MFLSSGTMIRSSIRNESGAVSIEFALIFPLFLVLLFGAYELGIFLHDKQVITNATREAARFGIIMQVPRPTQTQIEQQVVNWTATLVGANLSCVPGGACPDVQVTNAAGNSGTALTVTVTTQFQFPLLSNFSNFLPQIPIAAQTIMVLE